MKDKTLIVQGLAGLLPLTFELSVVRMGVNPDVTPVLLERNMVIICQSKDTQET